MMKMAEIISIGISVLMTVFCCLLLRSVWIGLKWVWLTPKKQEKYLRQQGFSGNSYRVIVGDLRESNKMDQEAHSKPLSLDADICSRVMPFINHTVKKYGKNCFTWLGPYMNVIVMDPEMLREILTKHEDWPKPIMSNTKELLVGLVGMEGEKWSKLRRFMNPAFRIENLKNLFLDIHLSCKEMLEEWETMALPNGLVEFDAWPYCTMLSKTMLARVLFGNKCYKEGLEIFELQHEYMTMCLPGLQSINIPGSRYLPTKFNRRLRRLKGEVRKMLKEKIMEKEKEIAQGKQDTNNIKDMISFMLVSNSKIIREQGQESGVTMEEIIDQCEQFYDAGETAVSALFVWTLIMLSQHQDWQDKARDEILQTFGHKEPDFDGLKRLKIVTMIFNEVLRLYPPAYFTARFTKKEMKLDKLSIPAGVLVMLPILLVHHDSDLWGNDVREFKPERFADGVTGATNGRLNFLPFSTGPRMCIGYQLTMIKGKILVAMLLQRFSLDLSPAYTHAPFPVKTTMPQHGARIIIRRL